MLDESSAETPRRSSWASEPNERPSRIGSRLQIDFGKVERRIGHGVDARQLLVMRRQELFDDQRRPRRVLPDLLLGVAVELRFFRLVGRCQCALDIGVYLVALVIRGVEQARRKGSGCEQRPDRPIGFTLARRMTAATRIGYERRESVQGFKSTSVKLNDASGMV